MTYQKIIILAGVIGLLAGGWLMSPPHSTAEQALIFNCNGVTELSVNECQALVAIYQNTNGIEWGNRYHSAQWLVNPNPCQWGGVICRQGRVVGLSLIFTGLRGTVPPAIANFSGLELLNLSNNNLHGPIPTWLGDLRNLMVLNLAGNLFNGPVPGSLGNLSRLEMLNLRDNYGLVGPLPGSLANLSQMKNFQFDETMLCEPVDAGFQNWINGVAYVQRNEMFCGDRPIPTPEPALVVTPPYTGPLVNVIRNGSFETPGPIDVGVAQEWERYSNGNAYFGWYDEQWEEAVYSGQHSQLMEIYRVYGNYPNRVIAIYQTVDVRPQSVYTLTFQAIMRSTAAMEDRNKGDYTLDWGIDFNGRGDHNAVELQGNWVNVPYLDEQVFVGSNSTRPDDAAQLRFQRIKATVHTGESSRITLFIRGVKRFPVGTEVNYNIDDVSLVGPPPW